MYKDMYSIGVPGGLKEPAWRLNTALTPVIKFYDCGGVEGHALKRNSHRCSRSESDRVAEPSNPTPWMASVAWPGRSRNQARPAVAKLSAKVVSA